MFVLCALVACGVSLIYRIYRGYSTTPVDGYCLLERSGVAGFDWRWNWGREGSDCPPRRVKVATVRGS